MWFGDYILSEFCHLSLFFLRKKGAGFLSPTPNIIEPFYLRVVLHILYKV